ncbi:MAG: ABC transporter ATP-binding protein [Schumannella sp.]
MSGLEPRGITVRAGDTALIEDASFAIPAGAVTALVGPNGAGKSTLLRALAGIERPATGEVLADGTDLLALGRRERARLLALVEQETTTELPLSVRAVVGLGRTPHESVLGGRDPEGEAIVDDAMRRAGVTGFALRDVTTLSGGERQRAILARALAQQPHVLLLDEPTSHLDVAAQLEVLRLLGELAQDGVTVLTALHDLTLAAHADHVVVLARGRVRASGPTIATLTPELLHEVFGVRAAWTTNPLTAEPLLAVSLPDPT